MFIPDLPTGPVTFLFTDIEGSTKLLQRLGDTYPTVLADHQRLLRQAWAEHAGHEIDTQGDSFFVVFARASDALAAAAQAQRALAAHAWPSGEHVRVRMGLHSGVGTLSHGHYVGLDVHRAARIAAAGHGGQVLLSQQTRDQVAKELVAGAGIRDLGRHRLKDLPRREAIYELVLPGLPSAHPPLKTLDAWPGYRADLVAMLLLSAVLLAGLGLALPRGVAVFPRWIGWTAGGVTGLALLGAVVARPLRKALVSQWRDARKPFAVTTSTLLSLVVVLTTLFITKPVFFVKAQHLGYDFSYPYHAPTKTGGSVTVGLVGGIQTLAPNWLGDGNRTINALNWQGCVVQLPDLSLGPTESWRPDQCTEVPTVDNNEEDPLGKWTIFHIDSRAVWSDGVPITASDFLFGQRLAADPNLTGGALTPIMNQMTLSALNPLTIQIRWAAPYPDYLIALSDITPVPLHVYNSGKFAGVYNAITGVYNSALAKQLNSDPSFNTYIPVDNGPYSVQNFVRDKQAVLVRNPRFFSNFFHKPVLDQITLLSLVGDFAIAHARHVVLWAQMAADAISRYRQGELDLAVGLAPSELSQLGGIPSREVISSSAPDFIELGFNQRGEAPNAQANGGISIFTDPNVRRAFVEAFDRCAAVRALLVNAKCNDPNLFTDEVEVATPDPTHDPTFTLPGYHPADAARLMTDAGYPVVDGIRRNKDGTTPLRLQLVVSEGASPSAVTAQRMQQDFKQNLQMDVTVVNDVRVWAQQNNPFVTGKFDLMLFEDATLADPLGRLIFDLGPFDSAHIISPKNPNGGNILGIIDPYVHERDQLAGQASADQRTGVLRSLERYFSQQYYVEAIYIQADVSLTKPTLCNFKHWPQRGSDLWNIADWYRAPSCP